MLQSETGNLEPNSIRKQSIRILLIAPSLYFIMQGELLVFRTTLPRVGLLGASTAGQPFWLAFPPIFGFIRRGLVRSE